MPHLSPTRATAALLAAAAGDAVLTGPPRPVSLETLLEFEREGHVATRGLLTAAELAEVAAELHEVAHKERDMAVRHAEWTKQEGKLDAGPPFLQTFNPHRRHRAARQLALSPVLAATAAALLGASCVRLYQDALFLKRPGHGATTWHADLWTAPLMTNSFVTVWLPLRAIQAQGDSPLVFQSKTHRDVALSVYFEDLQKLGIDPDDVEAPGEFGVHHAPLREGDATWHHGWTQHGAPPVSSSAGERLAYAASYFEDGALVPLEPPESEDGPSYAGWLQDLRPGDVAEHELLPVAYRAA